MTRSTVVGLVRLTSSLFTLITTCIDVYLQLGVGDDVVVVRVEQLQHVAAVVRGRPPRSQSVVAVQIVRQYFGVVDSACRQVAWKVQLVEGEAFDVVAGHELTEAVGADRRVFVDGATSPEHVAS